MELTRRYRFAASHILRREELSEEENLRTFGKCANPKGHGHNYELAISVRGPVNPLTGCLIAREALDRSVRERILERLAYRLLNEDPAFADALPTAENLVRFIRGELAEPLRTSSGVRLVGVCVLETRKNMFVWREAA